ncbi:MAG: hypothetical protein K6G58_07230 [Lachnospiraceae bacterium]|nr:hypothetical protein [Lachnospiraceae bacterium]
MMEFTYRGYERLLNKLISLDYEFSDYRSWEDKKRSVILRHDIDYDVTKALRLAELEAGINGVSSTYFVLLTSDLYNVFSKETNEMLRSIADMGHGIGLHFDEKRYEGIGLGRLADKIRQEAEILSDVLGTGIDTVSMHRPRKELLDAALAIPGMINSYSPVFFNEFKYVSDSRRRWREDIDAVTEAGYDRLHILTHAFWYNEEEIGIEDSVESFVNDANRCRYEKMSQNITDIGAIMGRDKIR